MGRITVAIAAALVISTPGICQAIEDPVETNVNENNAVVLVAKPEVSHPLYGRSVLIAKEITDSMHMGFILNKPTRARLGDAFPDHEPSRKLDKRLYLGGPIDAKALFMLVERTEIPRTSVQFAPDLFAVVGGETVDRLIEEESMDPLGKRSKFLFGTVFWRSGELAEEVRKGMWSVMKIDAVRPIDSSDRNLWEKLRDRADREMFEKRNGI